MIQQKIWLIRHGNRFDFVKPEWFNTAPRRYDPPLAQDGFIQAELIANHLQNEQIKHIFVSPFLRAIQTAYPLAQMFKIPLKIEQGLSEWFNEEWMSETPKTEPKIQLKKQFSLIDWDYQSLVIPQYPETEENLKQRTAKTINKLIENYQENMILVGHSASVSGCTLGLLSEDFKINTPLASITKIIRNKGQWKVLINGDISHLLTEN